MINMINVILAIAVDVLLIGAIGKDDKVRKRNITIAFAIMLLFAALK